jgi:hypothetical protein
MSYVIYALHLQNLPKYKKIPIIKIQIKRIIIFSSFNDESDLFLNYYLIQF